MIQKATDFKDAWVKAKKFLDDKTEAFLILDVDTVPYSCNYAVAKLPYGDDVVLLYAIDSNQAACYPCNDLKYAGFYSTKNEKVYEIREPLSRFFGFDDSNRYSSDLKDEVKRAIQNAITEHIVAHTEEYSGLTAPVRNTVAGDAEKAFSKNNKEIDFAEKIHVEDWSISEQAMVDYIAKRDEFLEKKVVQYVRERKEELARLWVAHCTAQKLLDRLYTECMD